MRGTLTAGPAAGCVHSRDAPSQASMLTVLAFAMVIVFMTLIMTRRMSALTALILVPTAVAMLGGFTRELGPMMLEGIRTLAPTGVMLMFAILYFGLMIDAGLFEPIVRLILRLVRGDPRRIVMGTALLALIVSLDGDGSTTYLLTVSAMLPLYTRLGIDPRILTGVIMLASGTMNVLPWGGPTARAASALKVDPSDLFVPMIPSLVGCALWTLAVAFLLGTRERRRLGLLTLEAPSEATPASPPEASSDSRRPRLLIPNALLTLALLGMLVLGVLPLPVLFMIAFCLAVLLNYPSLEEQKARIAAHAPNVLAVAGLIFAAGVFTGILSGTKMVDAMARFVISLIPPALGPFLPLITALLSVPFTFFISNDAFYFGVLPILAQTGAHYGVSAVAMGRASIVGQQVHLLSPLVPSTYLLVGLARVELGEHQRFTLKWAAVAALVSLGVALAVGAFPLRAALGAP